jgi:hypothetical protein
MSPEPLMKASPPAKGCPLLAVAVLGTLASLAGVITLGIHVARSVLS